MIIHHHSLFFLTTLSLLLLAFTTYYLFSFAAISLQTEKLDYVSTDSHPLHHHFLKTLL
mgnify:CR=1 FL=1